MMKTFCGIPLMLTALILLFVTDYSRAQNMPLANAFSHNDYQHKLPLFEALNNGYTYIEADVYVHKNRLVVTHVLPIIHHHRTLEGLYLAPLAKYISANNGQIYPGYNQPVTLMIDIKSDPVKTYQLLKPLLEKYHAALNGQVSIVLSGNKPYGQVIADTTKLVTLDADLCKINRTAADDKLLAMASCKYSKLLKWKGTGALSLKDRLNLTAYVRQAHLCGAKVRLWHSPDSPVVWHQLLQCGVDLINTDKLSRLREFLTNGNSDNQLKPEVNNNNDLQQN